MNKHTPVPWEMILGGSERHLGILRKQCMPGVERAIAEITFNDREEFNKANAAFIIKACNSHYELLEVLKSVGEYLEQRADAEYVSGNPNPVGNEAMRLLVEVQQVLSRAEAV
jgi:hypothetical protein